MDFSGKIGGYKTGSRCEIKRNRTKKKEELPRSSSRARVHFLLFLFLAGTLAIVFRLYNLQVLAYDSFKSLSDNQHWVFQNLVPKRGEIQMLEKNGVYPVAVNRETKMAYAVPKEVENISETSEKVSLALGLEKSEVFSKLEKPEDAYEVLKHRLSEEEIEKIQNLKLKGIRLADESFRYYPAGELASNVLGFVGWKGEDFGGRYGIELEFEERLRGRPGNIEANRDASGKWISNGKRDIKIAEDGEKLVLTIDHIIQYETERILKNAVSKFGADRGTVVVMETQTGKIRAMANYPTFDPNDYSSVSDMGNFRNLAVNDAYECGSVFKTFTMAAAIDDGKVNPKTEYIDTGSVTEAGYTIKNSDSKSYGRQTMEQVLENSLNTGVIYIEKLLGNKKFKEYVENFGFGKPTGVELFGEAGGSLNNLKNLRSNIQFFTASFGQGITVTPIQLAAAYNAIANDGILLKPKIIEKTIRYDGSEEEIQAEEVRRVISSDSARLVSEMLGLVVKNGHGKRAGVPGYRIGGKTGTAQVAKKDSKGYEEGANIGSFAGFAPLDSPLYTVVVRIDNPKEVEWAESSAAPIFGELVKFLLEYDGVEPTEEYTKKDLDVFEATHNLRVYERQENEKKDEKDEKEDK